MKKILTQDYKTDRTITLVEIFEFICEKYGLVYGEDWFGGVDISRDRNHIMEQHYGGYLTFKFHVVDSNDLRNEDRIEYEKEIALEEAQARGRPHVEWVKPNHMILHFHKDAKP